MGNVIVDLLTLYRECLGNVSVDLLTLYRECLGNVIVDLLTLYRECLGNVIVDLLTLYRECLGNVIVDLLTLYRECLGNVSVYLLTLYRECLGNVNVDLLTLFPVPATSCTQTPHEIVFPHPQPCTRSTLTLAGESWTNIGCQKKSTSCQSIMSHHDSFTEHAIDFICGAKLSSGYIYPHGKTCIGMVALQYKH